MIRLLLPLLLAAHLALPVSAWAQQANPRSPTDIALKTYGLMLGVALLGGVVSWFGKVRRSEIPMWSIHHLVGELATSALAGLLMFWFCEWAGFAPLLTAPLTGVAGHMGTRAITLFEEAASTLLPAFFLSLLAGCSTTLPSVLAKIDPPPVALVSKCAAPADLAEGATAQDLSEWVVGWIGAAGCERAKRAALIEAWPR